MTFSTAKTILFVGLILLIGRIGGVQTLEFFHGSGQRILGVFPVSTGIAEIKLSDEPVQIFLDPAQVLLHHFQDGGIEPFPLGIGQFLGSNSHHLGEMMHAKALGMLYLFPKFRVFEHCKKGGIVPVHMVLDAVADKAIPRCGIIATKIHSLSELFLIEKIALIRHLVVLSIPVELIQ